MINIPKTFDMFRAVNFGFDSNNIRAVSGCDDLCAFILLDKLVPVKFGDIVCAAEHDEIWLSTDITKLAEVATEEDIKFLVGCGVRYSGEHNCLCMYA